MSARLCIAFVAVASLVGGCTVNTIGIPGLVHVDHTENRQAYRTRLAAWGLHISTDPIDRGLTVGYSERVYIRPKSDAEAGDMPTLLQDLDEESWRPITQAKAPKPGAVCFSSRTMGFSIDANHHSIGLGLGFRSRYILEINKEYEGFFIVIIGNE